MKKRISCSFCSSNKTEKISDKVRYNVNKKICRCKNCEIVFLYPQMGEEEKAEYYRTEYRKLFTYGDTTEEHFQKALPESFTRKQRIMHLLSKDQVVLEIGCASGYFLYTIKDLVKEAHGVEPHIEYANYATNLGFRVFQDYNLCPKENYEVIFMFMTLEHFRNPLKSLIEIKTLLRPGGVLITEVPNVDDILISVFKVKAFRDFYWQTPHSWYFSPKTLLMILSKAGFKSEIVPIQRYDLSNNITWMIEGKPGGQGKYSHILSDDLSRLYASVLCEKLLCDTLMAISKKSR